MGFLRESGRWSGVIRWFEMTYTRSFFKILFQADI